MDASEIEPGAVFRFPHDDRPNRVLLHDSDVVMYDVWWPHLDGWGLAHLEAITRQRINYYVTTVSTIREKATYLRSDPMSADERVVHRPDLPFAVIQDPAISWSSDNPGRLTESRSELKASPIYLSPFGPSGGTKAGVRVVADNGASFTAEELFRKAQAAQARHVSDVMPTAGVGIYRSGYSAASQRSTYGDPLVDCMNTSQRIVDNDALSCRRAIATTTGSADQRAWISPAQALPSIVQAFLEVAATADGVPSGANHHRGPRAIRVSQVGTNEHLACDHGHRTN
jgi:hypothetical protein